MFPLFIGDLVGGAITGLTKGVRGVGRALRGDFGKAAGDFGDFLKDTALPVGGALIGGPMLGKIGGMASSALGSAGGGGTLGSIVSGAGQLLGGGGGGGTLGTLGNIASTALGGYQAYKGQQQAQSDHDVARQMMEQAMQHSGQASQMAQDEWQAGAPMRDEFRSGAMGFHDPSNPFSVLHGGYEQANAPAPITSPEEFQAAVPQNVQRGLGAAGSMFNDAIQRGLSGGGQDPQGGGLPPQVPPDVLSGAPPEVRRSMGLA